MAEALGDPLLAQTGYWQLEAEQGRYRAAWGALGLSEARMLDIARDFSAAMPNPPQGPKALDGAMQRAAKAVQPKATRHSGARPLAARVHVPIDERVSFWREQLTSGRYVPPSALSAEVRACLIHRGHFTEGFLRGRGL